MQLLGFLSKTELISKLNSLLAIMEQSDSTALTKVKADLQAHIATVEAASLEVEAASTDILSTDKKLNRQQLKEVRSEI